MPGKEQILKDLEDTCNGVPLVQSDPCILIIGKALVQHVSNCNRIILYNSTIGVSIPRSPQELVSALINNNNNKTKRGMVSKSENDSIRVDQRVYS